MRIEASSSTSPFSRRSTMPSSSFSACSKLMVLMSEWSVGLAMVCLNPFRLQQSRGSHQRRDMGGGGRCQRLEIVTALQGRNELPAGVFRGNVEELLSYPHEIALDQPELSQGVPHMGIETGRDQEKVGGEIVQGRQDARQHRFAEIVAVIAWIERCVEDVADARLTQCAGAGKERHLVGRAIEQIFVGPERCLRAIAVMHVEIDDGNALCAMGCADMERRNRHGVEQAEAHGA